jgi:hypothetical protein
MGFGPPCSLPAPSSTTTIRVLKIIAVPSGWSLAQARVIRFALLHDVCFCLAA